MARGDERLCIGIDLGGTKLAAALIAADGEVLRSTRRPSLPEQGADRMIEEMARAVDELTGEAGNREILGVGVGVAGQVDPESGIVRHAPNLHWNDLPLQSRLAEAARLPVAVLNDVQAATYGEWTSGAGQGVDDLVCIFVGTGVGGGVVANGQLVRGATGSAGEIGHMTVALTGPLCRCGNRGCVEAFAGGWAIAERARQAVQGNPALGARLLAIESGDHGRIAGHTVAQAADAGDELALHIIQETGEALGAAAANIVNGFNPRLVVLGGGVIEGMQRLLPVVEETMRRRALRAASEGVRVVPPLLGAHAGSIGAATWIRRQLGHAASTL